MDDKLPKMCPDCAHRCYAPTVTLGNTGCDHCKALRQARADVLVACIADVQQAAKQKLPGNSEAERSMVKAVCYAIELRLRELQPTAKALEELLRQEREKFRFLLEIVEEGNEGRSSSEWLRDKETRQKLEKAHILIGDKP